MANTHAKSEMELYRSFVRKIIVAKPSASLAEIQKQLVGNNLPKLHVDTITKIKNKILAERVHKMNRIFLSMRLGEQLDSRTEILNHAWGIMLNPEDNNQKMAAMRLILQEEHEWTKLLILVGILDQGDKRASALLGVKEKDFPEETFDPIMQALGNNMFRPQSVTFKYLPEVIEVPKTNNQTPDDKPAASSADEPRFVTLIPVKDDRSFAVPTR